jgi:hypothetical protein
MDRGGAGRDTGRMPCRPFAIPLRKELCLRRGRCVDLTRQLRPDSAPVAGPKIGALNRAPGEALDIGTVLDRNATHLPVANSCGRNPELCGEEPTASESARGPIQGMVCLVHSPI